MKPFKAILKSWVPVPILQLLGKNSSVIFSGNYPSWEAARKASSGYDAEVILERVKTASLKVKHGEAVYERDSVIFDRIYYSFPVLSGLLRVALEQQGKLSVLDFGGSLGSSYYQCRTFLSSLSYLRWSIVEQPHFVACGKEFFEDEVLRFYNSIDDCLRVESPHIILLSGVIQCLENPCDFIKHLIDYQFSYILIDRTAFTVEGNDRLTVEQVPASIYPASYPAWFLDQRKFMKIFEGDYKLISEFDALTGEFEIHNPYAIGIDKGFIFERLR